MCRYCGNLKRIKDLEISDLRKVVDKWKRREFKARCLISRMALALYCSSPDERDALIASASKYLDCKYIGK